MAKSRTGRKWTKMPTKTELERKDDRQRRQLRTMRDKVDAAPMAGAAGTIAGAAAVGAFKAKVGPDLLGAPAEPIGGVALAVAGIALKKPMLLSFAAGWLAPYIAEMTENALS